MTVISLTSLPGRTHFLRYALKDLLEMTPCAIFVFIPHQPVRQVSAAAEPIETFPEGRDPRVTIIRTGKDYGPISKYLAAYPTKEWTLVVDDDQRFVASGLETILSHAHPKNDRKVFTGCTVPNSLLISHVQGCACVLLPPQAIEMIHSHVTQDKMPKCCARVDDDYVSWFLHANKFTIEGVFPHREEITITEHLPNDSLNMTNRVKDTMRCRLYLPEFTVFGTFVALMCISLLTSCCLILWTWKLKT